VILVLVGLIALFGGVTSFFDLLRLWPVLIIFGGIMTVVNPGGEPLVKRVAEGLGSISFGLVLLGNTFGYLPWSVWITVLSLWPVLLVALGIELVGRGLRMDWIRAASNVVLILALAYAVFVMQPASGRTVFPFVTSVSATAGSPYSDSAPHDAGAATGSAEIKVGATRLGIKAGDTLASISGRAPADGAPKLTASVEASAASVSVSQPGDRVVYVGTDDRTLDVTLDRSVTWDDLRLDMGAVSGDADLSGLDVRRVTMNVGASDVKVKIGRRSKSVSVDVSGGATSITVVVPADAACTVNCVSGLSNVGVPRSFRRTSGIGVIGNSTYVSDGSGGPKIEVDLASGVSDLRIQTY
jgi:hypothetical protein